jgi:GLPGLI family protein
MKNFMLMVAALVVSAASAQDFQGIAVYQSKSGITITSSGDGPPMDDEMKAMLSKLTDKSYTLVFNKTESVYEEEAKLESPSVSIGGVSINMGGDKLYKNLKDKTFSREMDMMGKEFLINDSLKKNDWVLLNETKKIGEYTCYKATYTIVAKPLTDEEKEEQKSYLGAWYEPKDIVVTAWYTMQVPVSHGPGDYWGLPGLILEVNNGATTILCSKITLNPKEKVAIKVPKKGQKVTSEEFEGIMKKKIEEMNEMNRPAGNSGNTTSRTTIRIGG